MTTLDKIKAEIRKMLDRERDFTSENARVQALALVWCLELIDKYAEQEPCENCDYSEIMDWEQDAKTGKAKPIYWCERHKEPCDDVVSRQAVIDELNKWDWQELYLPIHFKENIIDVVPSVRPQEQTGHWIYKNLKGQFCSICDEQSVWKFNYCPNCGARMESEVRNENTNRNTIQGHCL